MINIIYNILNLPQRHTVGGGLTTVDYMYAADGRKFQEKVTSGTSVTIKDYVGELLYESSSFMFFLRDHLGSVRAVVSQTGEWHKKKYDFDKYFFTSRTNTLEADGLSWRFRPDKFVHIFKGDDTMRGIRRLTHAEQILVIYHV